MIEPDDLVLVNRAACVRCGACSTIAPEIFELRATGSDVLRQPSNARERARAAVAARICPTAAIRAGDAVVGALAEDRARADDFVGDALYYRLFDEAEKARWRVADVPLDAVAKDRVSPALVEAVRANVTSELTTFTATRRFFQEFADDPDLSQWITVWAYEETKHPQILMRWLASLGETFDAAFVMRGRWTSPFARSRIAMLATNVVSEMVASASYMRLARRVDEPVLASIATFLGSDEARHAASFFRYAERALARAERPDAERAAALRVLHVWLNEPEKMGHPVHRFQEAEPVKDAGFVHPLDSPAVRSRVCDVISTLVGERVKHDDDLLGVARAIDEAERGARSR
jgi:ferredoxin/ferritin